MKKELIRQRDILITGGTGVCLFGLWSVIRIVMSIIMNEPEAKEILDPTQSFLARLIAVAAIIVIAGIIIAIHLYIGLSSRAEGFRPRKRKAYIVVTILFAIAHIAAIGYDVFKYDFVNKGYLSYIVTICMDVTLLLTLAGIVTASFRIRRLEKQMEERRHE